MRLTIGRSSGVKRDVCRNQLQLSKVARGRNKAAGGSGGCEGESERWSCNTGEAWESLLVVGSQMTDGWTRDRINQAPTLGPRDETPQRQGPLRQG